MKFKQFYSLILGIIIGVVISYSPLSRKCLKPSDKKENIKRNIIDSLVVTTSHVRLTCYRPIKEECDSEPLITADNSKIDLPLLEKGELRWCAISRDLLDLFPKDKSKRIYIEGYGIYYVKDIMNKRYIHSVDILLHPNNSKKIMKKNVEIKILK